MRYYKLNQEVILIVATVAYIVFLLEQIKYDRMFLSNKRKLSLVGILDNIKELLILLIVIMVLGLCFLKKLILPDTEKQILLIL